MTPRAWLRVAVAMAAVGWGANQFASLLLVYRRLLPLSDATSEATFGFYALGLIPGFLIAGRLSDRIGRRRVILPSIVLSLLASVLLIMGRDGAGWLFAGRFAAGVASAGAFAAGAAWLKELSADAPHAVARRTTVAMTAGFGFGPLCAGLLAQFAPHPGVVPYLPHLALGVVALAGAASTPETRRAGAVTVAPVVPELRRPRFAGVVAPMAPWVFGAAAVSLAYLPGLLSARLGTGLLGFTAVVTGLTPLAGIAVQPVARRLDRPDRPRLLAASLGVVVAGMLVAALAAATRQPWLVIVAGLVLGAAYGATQVCGFLEVGRVATPDALAGVTSVYQALTYVGFAFPFLLALAGRVVAPWVGLVVLAALAVLTLAGTVPVARRLDDPVPVS